MTDRRRPLTPLFEPRSVAVVGASSSPGKAGFAMLEALAAFPGPVHPVNPSGGLIQGRTAYPRVTDVPGPVDLAVLVVPAAVVPGALVDCVEAGVRAALICAGGFAEAGPDGRALQDRVAGIAGEGDLRLLGPNTSGFLVPASGLRASFVPEVAAITPGSIAVVAQSGGVSHALAFLLQNQGAGARLAVGLGNAIDVSVADVLDHLADDPTTGAVAIHLEGVVDGRRLFDAVERTCAAVPVIVLKAGRADVGDFARSHTGALIGSWALARAALRQAGAVVVDDSTALVDAARALATLRLPALADPGVAVVTGQAGPGLLVADRLRQAGVSVPTLRPATVARIGALLPPVTYQRNPVDTGRPPGNFGDVLLAAVDDPGIDAAVIYALHEPQALDAVAVLGEVRGSVATPLVFGTGGLSATVAATVARLDALDVPAYPSPERAAGAMVALVTDARARHRRTHADGATPAVAAAGGRWSGASVPATGLDEHQAKQLLAAMGVDVPRSRICTDRVAAAAAVDELGPPVVVKILSSAVVHKSDVGGVHVGVSTAAQLDRALDAIDRIDVPPGAGPVRYLVEEQLPGGPELIVGARRDPAWGPVVMVGLGGVVAEALADVAFRVTPVTTTDVEEMLDELSGCRVLEGWRGAPVVDRGGVAAVALALVALLQQLPAAAEVEVNPLRACAGRLVALDALVVVEGVLVEGPPVT